MLLYYITDRCQFSGDEASRRSQLLDKIAETAHCGVDVIQLREKDLSARELVELAQEALRIIRSTPETATKFLINSRTDIAIASEADGVHLRSADISPTEVREIWRYNLQRSAVSPFISVACHTAAEVSQAGKHGANCCLFSPVFEKKSSEGQDPLGIAALGEASHLIPVIALGGVSLENAQSCINAGAAGIAGIRIFQDNNVRLVVSELRKLSRQSDFEGF